MAHPPFDWQDTPSTATPVSAANLEAASERAYTYTDDELAAHTSRTDNPHAVTKTQLGLGNVDNTSDVNKPVSTATQTALNLKANAATAATQTALSAEASTRAADDVALDGRLDAVEATLPNKADLVGGVLTSAQIPAIATNEYVTAANQAAMLALTGIQPGDIAVRTDTGKRWMLVTTPISTLSNWVPLEIAAGGGAVDSVNGFTGTVVLGYADVGAASTSDARLSDERTPTNSSVTLAKLANAIKPSGSAAAGDEAVRALGTSGSTAAAGNDARLSDTRTPTDASVTLAKLANAIKPSGTAAAGDEAVRALGTSGTTAAAGNDARLSDTRTPTDGTVTAAKVAGSLKPTGSAAAGDESLRALGTSSSTAAAGNDARLTNRNDHGFAVAPPTAVTLPGFNVSIGSGRVKKLIKMRHFVDAGTTTTFYVRKNGTAVTGFGTSGSPITASNNTTGAYGADTDPTDVTLSDGDYLDVVIVAAGTAARLSVTLVVEES